MSSSSAQHTDNNKNKSKTITTKLATASTPSGVWGKRLAAKNSTSYTTSGGGDSSSAIIGGGSSIGGHGNVVVPASSSTITATTSATVTSTTSLKTNKKKGKDKESKPIIKSSAIAPMPVSCGPMIPVVKPKGSSNKIRYTSFSQRVGVAKKSTSDDGLFPGEETEEDRDRRLAENEERKKLYEIYVNGLKHSGLHALSGEIDRCLKKVTEGVETFEDIWQKVHNATNANQKEKYETDLKKEIKKLQRLRDQIKSWIASAEIKDKSTLIETRKLIETQMERFKVVERETKTKAYSKEGLGAAQKLDPITREREDLNQWLITMIDQMQLQMDQFDCEMESILAAKKKKLDKDKQDRLDELKVLMDKHKFHMGKLETLLRMLDNLSVDTNSVYSHPISLRKFLSQVKKIKDDIEYYLESSQEPEFEDNEFLYDDIDGLEEQQALGNLALTVGADGELVMETTTSIISGNNSSAPVSPSPISDSSSDPEKRRKSSDDSSKLVRPVAMKPLNHSPSPSKIVSDTPPKTIGTPNNSSPSSGLSNHVSSLSSLSSSPTQTQNYHNALNNVNSHLDSEEQHNKVSGNRLTNNNSPNNLSNFTNNENGLITDSGDLGMNEDEVVMNLYNNFSPPPSSNASTTSQKQQQQIQRVTSPNQNQHHHLPTQLPSPTTTSFYPNENGIDSPTSQHQSPILSSSSSINNNTSSLLNQQEHNLQHNIQANPLPAVPSEKQHVHLENEHLHSMMGGVFTSSSSAGGGGNTTSTPFGSIMSLGMSIMGGNLNHNGAVGSGIISASNNSSGSVLPSAGGTSMISSVIGAPLSSNTNNVIGGNNINNSSSSVGGGLGVSGLGSLNSMSGYNSGASGVSVSSHNSNQLLQQQQQHQLSQQIQSQSQQQPQQQQQQQQLSNLTQSGNSREATPPSMTDILTMQQEQQMLLRGFLPQEGDTMATLKTMAQEAIDRAGININESFRFTSDHEDKRATTEAHIPPLLGVAPLGPVPLGKDAMAKFQMLEAASYHLPVPADSERMRQFLPRNPFPTPSYYPQHPITNSDTLEFFQRLSIETLFFIFYYLEGTRAQYLAARVLKKQSWRFHTKYMMWFQRHEEPKVINEDYEQGTYIYFDIEKWGQRKKDGFVFEYKYLEDIL